MYTFKYEFHETHQVKNKGVSINLKNLGKAQLRKSEGTKKESKGTLSYKYK